ncbi:sensor histidine kinase [Nocardioides sp. SYSU DS0663]|uniref:sensor histidine kinase n=1 Tax=Nocardioides sp. SYSU DS0663 TaxID=3416445 RepID=UPI003F4C47AB
MRSTLSLEAQRRRYHVVVPVAAGLVAIFAGLLLPSVPADVRETASAVGLVLAGGIAGVGCLLRARLSVGRKARAWWLFAAAAGAAVVGNLWVAATGASLTGEPALASDISVAVALAFSIAGMLSFPTARRRGRDLAMMALDAVVVASAVLIVASVLVYQQLLDAGDGSWGERVWTLFVPFLEVALVTIGLLLVVRARGRSRPALALLAVGFLLYAATDLSYAVRVAEGTFGFGSPADLGWIAGYLTIAAAAWYPARPGDGAGEERIANADARDTVLLFLVVGVAFLVQVLAGDTGDVDGPQRLLWLALGLSVAARQVLLTVDNAQLRRGLERRVAEQTADLRRLARQTEVLLTSVGDGIYGVDDRGSVTAVNPSAAHALGYRPDQLLGRSAHDLFHAPPAERADWSYAECYIAQAIRSGRVTSAEEDVYRRSDGTTFPVEITASPLVDEETVTGAVVVFRDVTQRREVDRLKNEFLSVVSHELRTPLTSIHGTLTLLAAGHLGDLSTTGTSMAHTALESTERLTRLINDILDLERIESGAQAVTLGPVDVPTILGTAVAEMTPMAEAAAVRLEVEAAPVQVLADDDRVVQILTNLLHNAIKFSPAGGRVTVSAAAQPSGDAVLFRVQDQGRGIPADQAAAVFDRFHQVDSSDARQEGGTGLGLAITRGIVERLGGRIWAESAPDGGARLSFTLPVPRPPAPSDGSVPTTALEIPRTEKELR